MNNEQLFAHKINDLENEIRALKTAHFKTATTISTMSSEKSLGFNLQLDMLTGEITSSRRAVLTLTTTDGSDMISACYVKGVTPQNLDYRYPFVNRLDAPAGQARFEVLVFSQRQSDFETLIGGGSVTANYTVELVGSSEFTVSLEYKNILGGS